MKKIAILTICALLVGGCALPLPLTVASLVADGVSYATTQKSLTDHGISVIAQRDCAMHRVITEGGICDNVSNETVAALSSAEETQIPPFDIAPKDVAATPFRAATDLGAYRRPLPGVYVVISSSSDAGIAKRAALRFANLQARVYAQALQGHAPIFHVVAGPTARDEFHQAKTYLGMRGVGELRTLNIDEDDWRSGQWILKSAEKQALETASNKPLNGA